MKFKRSFTTIFAFSLLISLLHHTTSVTFVDHSPKIYDEILAAAIIGAHEKKELPTAAPSVITLYQAIQNKAVKPLKSLSAEEINSLIGTLDVKEKEIIYNSFTREDKKIVIKGLGKGFWDTNNSTISLAAYFDIITFLVMKGQGLEDLQPIIKEEKKTIEHIKKAKRFSLGFLWKFQGVFDKIKQKVPIATQNEVQELFAPDLKKLGPSKAARFASIITILAKRINPTPKRSR